MRFKVLYTVQGEIEIEAENMEDALEKFDEGEVFTKEELYENLGDNFNGYMVKKL